MSNIVKLESFVNRKNGAQDQTKRITDPKILRFMVRFSENDRESAVGERLAGEIYHLYFQAEESVQSQFVNALAKANHLSAPDDAGTPRQRLIWAVYGANDDLVSVPKGEHDSKGGKRITAAIRTYLETVSGAKKRKRREKEYWPRTTRKFLDEVLAAAKPEEKRVLMRLVERVYGKKLEVAA